MPAKKRGRPAKTRKPLDPPFHDRHDFLPRFPHQPGEHGVPTNEREAAGAAIESICGGVNDSQPVEQYDGTLGVTVAFVTAHQAPVGQLQWNDNLASIYDNPGNVSGVRWCTGTLVSSNLFLTAGHCFDQTGGGWQRPRINGTSTIIPPSEIATNMKVNFNYQVDPDGNLRTEQSFAVTELVEYRLNGLDFAIARLAGNPGASFGTTTIAAADAAVNDMLCVIQHPQGVPKRIEAGPLTGFDGNFVEYDDIDTLGGSSGSGLLGPAGTIVGVHTNGGCDSPAIGNNHGVRISAIIAASPTVRSLLPPKLKFADDPITLKFLDDPITLKFLDDPITLKFRDDPITFKFRDDPITFKFRDDVATFKFRDDPNTFKFRDDPITLKFRDDLGTDPGLDPVKQPGLDKQPGTDVGGLDPAGQPGEAAPFILSTPHHSQAWAQSYPAAHQAQADDYEAAIRQYEEALQEAQKAESEGRLSDEDRRKVEELYREYQALVAEYQQTCQRG